MLPLRVITGLSKILALSLLYLGLNTELFDHGLSADTPKILSSSALSSNNLTITGHDRDGLLDRFAAQRGLASLGISPDGQYLTGLVAEGEDQRAYVWRADNPVMPAGLPDERFTGIQADEAISDLAALGWHRLPYIRRDINWLAWVGADRLVISSDKDGLVLVDAETGKVAPLIRHAADQKSVEDSTLPIFLISAMVHDPSRMLVQFEDPDTAEFPAIYAIDIDEGTISKVQAAHPPVIRWWATENGVPKVGEGYRARNHELYIRQADGWQRTESRDVFRQADFSIISLTEDGAGLFLISEHKEDRKALWRYDFAAEDFVEQIAAHDTFDITGVTFSPVDRRVMAATYTDLTQEQEILDDRFERQLDEATERIGLNPNDLSARLWFSTATADGKKTVYQVRSEKHPIRYYLHDAELDTYTAINPSDRFDDYHRTTSAWIKLPKKRGEMQVILSVPKNTDGRIKLTGKGILLIHGGPVRRSSQRYNRFLNWLTAHGYAVLQPNFRGSSGYGARWRRSGYEEWGADMQDDIETAAKWFIKEGYVDADSLCAVGGSYGGYAALLGTIKDKDLFQCAVSLNGVTSLPHLVTYLSSRRFSLLTVPRIRGGLSGRTLRRRSPLYLARRLKRPALLLHATNDANVPFEHGQLMASVLKQYDKDYGFIILPGAEHQLKYPRFRKTYYESALQFLEKHIGDKRALPFDKPLDASTDEDN